MNVKFFKRINESRGYLIYGYLAAMFSIFLFYYQDYYFDLTPSKYSFYQALTFVLIVGGMLISCSLFITKELTLSSFKKEIQNFSITDWAFMIMLVSHIITTAICMFPTQSMYGLDGRQSGLIFTFLFTSVYFLVSRWYQQEASVLILYLFSGVLVIGLGILNFYGIDPLHFFTLLSQFDTQRYLSTMGNIQFFAHLICLSLPISAVLFTHAKKKESRLVYGTFVAFGFAGLYVSNLDGGYLGIFAFMAFYLYYSLSSYEKIKDFIILVLIALSSGKILYAISSFFPYAGRGFFTLSELATSSSISTFLLVGFVLLYILCQRYEHKVRQLKFQNLRKCYIIISLVASFAILSVIFYMSFVDTTTEYPGLSNYFRYNDEWGTGRGFIWNNLMSIYMNQFDFIAKLFGSGLDTIRTVFVEFTDVWGISNYDNAHNEYVQYLITTGLFGLISYCFLFFSIQIRLFKGMKQNPWMLAILGCLIAHGAQALTGLNQPITTPLLYILIAIGENFLRKEKSIEPIQELENMNETPLEKDEV